MTRHHSILYPKRRIAPVVSPGVDGGIGGLVGAAETRSSIKDTYAIGTVTDTGDVGGLIGQLAETAAVEDSYSTGKVTGGAMDLPFPGGSLDAVHCHGFLMHSPGIRDRLAEIGGIGGE